MAGTDQCKTLKKPAISSVPVKSPHNNCSVPAEIPHKNCSELVYKNCSLPAEIPHKYFSRLSIQWQLMWLNYQNEYKFGTGAKNEQRFHSPFLIMQKCCYLLICILVALQSCRFSAVKIKLIKTFLVYRIFKLALFTEIEILT